MQSSWGKLVSKQNPSHAVFTFQVRQLALSELRKRVLSPNITAQVSIQNSASLLKMALKASYIAKLKLFNDCWVFAQSSRGYRL